MAGTLPREYLCAVPCPSYSPKRHFEGPRRILEDARQQDTSGVRCNPTRGRNLRALAQHPASTPRRHFLRTPASALVVSVRGHSSQIISSNARMRAMPSTATSQPVRQTRVPDTHVKTMLTLEDQFTILSCLQHILHTPKLRGVV